MWGWLKVATAAVKAMPWGKVITFGAEAWLRRRASAPRDASQDSASRSSNTGQ